MIEVNKRLYLPQAGIIFLPTQPPQESSEFGVALRNARRSSEFKLQSVASVLQPNTEVFPDYQIQA